jgi:hypothetical protein
MLQNVQLALAGIIALFALIHLIPIINPITALAIVWIFAVGYGLVTAIQVVQAGGIPLLWYFTKLSFTDNV